MTTRLDVGTAEKMSHLKTVVARTLLSPRPRFCVKPASETNPKVTKRVSETSTSAPTTDVFLNGIHVNLTSLNVFHFVFIAL